MKTIIIEDKDLAILEEANAILRKLTDTHEEVLIKDTDGFVYDKEELYRAYDNLEYALCVL